MGCPGGSDRKESACNATDLGQEDPPEKGKAAHSGILAWRIPWTKESSGLQSLALPPLNLDLIRERRQRFQAKGVHVKFSSTLIGDGVAEACLLEKFKKQMEQLQSIKLTWTGWGSWGSVSGRSPPEAPIRPLYVAG